MTKMKALVDEMLQAYPVSAKNKGMCFILFYFQWKLEREEI